MVIVQFSGIFLAILKTHMMNRELDGQDYINIDTYMHRLHIGKMK